MTFWEFVFVAVILGYALWRARGIVDSYFQKHRWW